MKDTVIVEAVHVTKRLVLYGEGVVVPIEEFLDFEGDECDLECAEFAVAGTDEHGWVCLRLDDYVAGKVH